MTNQKADYPLDYGKGITEQTKDKVQDLTDAAADQFKEASDKALDMAGKFAEQAKEYGEKAQEVVSKVRPHVEQSMKEQPMATLGAAAIIGFVLGALWKK